MRDSVIKLDGTRPFIPSSSGFAKLPAGWDGAWPDGKPSGVYSGGPYTWQDPKDYYKRADAGGDWVFKDETGLPSQPPYSSLPLNITNLVWDKSLPFPVNNSWGYHDACSGNGNYEKYFDEMIKRYGKPSTMKEFSDKMQLMNAVGYQGIFEAAGHKLNDIGGVMLWKLNAAFPSVVWQVYDWFLVPNAGYYFMQNAVEKVHIQLNVKDLNIEYINRTYNPEKGLTATIDIFDINSKSLLHRSEQVDLGAPEAKEGPSVSDIIKGNKGVSFVLLSLRNAGGRIISRNSYWISPDEDFKSLNSMPATSVNISVSGTKQLRNETEWTFTVSNKTSKIAFFINPQLMTGDKEIAPSFWSSNYFTLAPGESIDLRVGFPKEVVKNGEPWLKVGGWNVEEMNVSFIQALK
jgi:exo-1,4-beta-D-glucosaminidase